MSAVTPLWTRRAGLGRPLLVLSAAAVAIAMFCAGSMATSPRLVWNFTPSVPVGLYWLEDRAWVREDRVALRPSGRLQEALTSAGVLKPRRLLLKHVAAAAGDVVCRIAAQVTMNGAPAAVARPDPDLPAWSGCVRLGPEDIFLLGETDNSFDGRYFGVTSATDIVGPVWSLLTF